MKKNLFHILMILFLTIGLGISASPVAAEGNRTPVTASEIPQCPYHTDCTFGETTFPGGNLHIRNSIQIYAVSSSSDDRIEGTNTLVVNANFDADGLGPGWGTFHNESSIYDGYWEGTWAAMMSEDGYVSRIVGKGHGDFEGLLFQAT